MNQREMTDVPIEDRDKTVPLRPALEQEIDFTPDDLDTNRLGKLSEMQDYNLRVRRQRSIAIGVAILLMVAVIASLLIFLGTDEGGSIILTLIGIGLTICNAALVGTFARHWFRLTADIRGGICTTSTGKLERVIKPMTRRVMNYMIRVGEVEVFVSKETFEAFYHGQIYTLYRAPHTGTLLSAERLQASP